VKGPKVDFKKLARVRGEDFERYVTENAPANHLVVVACLRKDDLTCRKAEQTLEKLNGYICKAKNQSDRVDDRTKRFELVVKFEMSESNFLRRRYNIQTLPMILMYYGGKLVYGGTMGGVPIKIRSKRERPPLLLYERRAKDQIAAEKILRKLNLEWDLASDVRSIHHHCRIRERFSVALISVDDSSSDDVGKIVSLFRTSKKATRRRPLVAVVLPSGTVEYSKRPLFDEKGKRIGKQRRVSSTSSGDGLPLSCLKTRILDRPTSQQLRGAHYAVQKPLTAATIDALRRLWMRQEFCDSPTTAPDEPPADLGMSMERMLAKMREALDDGEKGRFLDSTQSASFGASLRGNGTVVCGTALC